MAKLFLLYFMLVLPGTIWAQEGNFINVPASITVEPQDTFSVRIDVQTGGLPVDGAEIHLDYDPSILQVNSVAVLTTELETAIVPGSFDNVLGQIDYVRGSLIQPYPTEDFDFIEIDFEVIGTGDTNITYNSVFPRRTDMTSGGFSVLGTPSDIPVTIAEQTENPIADFTATPTSGTANLFVSVDANASFDPDDIDGPNIVSYEWDFGDTNTATGVIADNTYTAPGIYTITLTVTDDDNETATATQNIMVDGITIPSYTVTANAGANGSISPESVIVDEGGSQVFTITPDAGYEVADVLVDGNSVGAVSSYELTNVQANTDISATFSLLNGNTVPEITLDATAAVVEGGSISAPLLITDEDGDALTVTVTTISNEPQELQSNNGPIQKEPYPFDASGFLTENITNNLGGLYSSNLEFAPTFGDGGSNGDGNAVYTVTVSVTDEDNNTITKTLDLTVNDAPQLISDTLITAIEAESFDNQGPANPGDGDLGIGVEDNTATVGGVINIGFTNNGDFAEYLIDVVTAGIYEFSFQVAKGSGSAGTMTINGGPASLSVDPTGGWQTYTTINTNVTLPAGQQTLRFDWSGPGGFYFNVDSFLVSFLSGVNNPPTIDAIADVEVDEGETLTANIQVNDDGASPMDVSIDIYDKSVPGGSNNPFIPAETLSGYSFTDNGSGSYTLSWDTDTTDGRSYEARVTADDTVNPPIIETFTIDVAQDISEIILARTFSNPLPWYGDNPQGDFSISIEGDGNIGWTENNEFVEYLIDVPAAGNYTMSINAAKGNANSGLLTVSEENVSGFAPIGSVTVIQNGWSAYGEYQSPVTFANAGLQTLRLDFSGGMNITDFNFTSLTGNTPPIVDIVAPINDLSVEEGTSIEFTATAEDTENGNVAESLIWTSDIDGEFGTGPSVTADELSSGIHTITASATDEDPTAPLTRSASITVLIYQTAPACDVRFRVNAGGALFANSTGNFDEDQAAVTANGTAQIGTPSPYLDLTASALDLTYGATDPLVSNTTGYPDELFQTERYSDAQNPNNMKWSFPTGNGIYDVKILFNENWTGEIDDPRVFDVEIEGEIALDDYRPSGPAGAEVNVAKVETYQATVIDGELNINFLKGSQNPSVKGFDICFVAPVSDSDPVVAIAEPLDGTVINRNVTTTFTGSATDVEDDDVLLTSSLSWSTATDPSFSGTGGTFTDVLLNPGTHVITAQVTDSDENTGSESITVTVPGPEVAFTSPVGGAVLDSPEVRFEWTALNMLLTESFGEHFHLYVNPADPDNLDSNERISTASEIGQLFWELDTDDGIVEGENTVVIVAAESLHTEFTNPEARDLVTFSVCSTTITDIVPTDPAECIVENGEIVIEATGDNLEYSIDGGETFQATNEFTGLGEGSYDIVVRAIGSTDCEATDTVILTAPEAPMPIVSGDTTYPEGSGGVTLDAGEGYASYLWSNGETTQTVTVLAGTYSVTVTEANGCQGTSIGIVVTEDEDETPPTAICQSIIVELDGLGNGSITASQVDNGSNDTSGIAELALSQSTFTCADLGENTVTLTVTDNNGNTSTCLASVTVRDNSKPVITCPANIDRLSASSLVLDITPATAADNCDGDAAISFVRSDNKGNLNDPFEQGITTIQWTATDASGNIDTCLQTITITLPQSTANEIVAFSVDGQVGAENIDSNAGTVNLTVEIGTVLTSLAPEIEISDAASIDPASGTPRDFSNTATPISYTVTAEDGSTKEWGVTVTVEDDVTDPEIACPVDITVNNDPDICGASVSFEAPVGTDNLPGVVTERTEGLASGAVFPIGTTIQTYLATDTEGNEATCSFTVTVLDAEVPIVQCPNNISATAASGETTAVVNYIEPSISDNCPGAVLTQTSGLSSGSDFPIGITVNTFQAEDAAGNVTTCSFEVSVTEEVVNDELSLTALTLIDADSNQDLFPLADGMVIDINSLSSVNLNVRADTTDDVESVSFALTGTMVHTQTENIAPFALYGDQPTGNYSGEAFTAGTYTLTATPYSENQSQGEQGETRTLTFELVNGDPDCLGVAITVQSATDPTTCGGEDGSISLSVTGTTGDLDYDWGHDPNLESATASGLTKGSYSVTVTDANGCTKTVSAELEDPVPAAVTLSPFADISETASPITLSGGLPSGGTYSGAGVGANGTFDPSIGAGTYTVTYSYSDPATGCDGAATRTITVTSETIDSELTVLNANTDTPLYALVDGLVIQKGDIGNTPLGIIFEPGTNPGSVRFTLSGPLSRNYSEGAAPYSLYGDIGVDIQGRVFPVGAYTLVVNPRNGPTITVNFEVTDIDPVCTGFDVAVQSANDPSVCNGTDGSITLAISGGAAPFAFDWDHDTTLDSATATGLSAGSYTVTVTDANACSETVTVTLDALQGPTVALSAFANVSDDVPAFALTGGSPSGGSYSGTGVGANGTFDPSIGAGTYTITYSYTDPATGCDGAATRTITVTSETMDSELTVVNADTDAPLYALVDGLVIQKNDIGDTPLGIIYEPGTNPGLVRFTLSGPLSRNYSEGAAPYSLYGDIGVDIQGRVFPVGAYTLVVNPSNGSAITVDFEVTDIDPVCSGFDVAVQSANDPSVCNGTDGSIALVISGGAAPFAFDWDHDNTLDSSTATGLSAGSYTVTATDANACSETLTVTLDAPQGPTVTLSAFASVSDDAPAFALTGGSPSGGTYSGTGVGANGTFDPSIGAGTYTVTYSYSDPVTGCDGSAARAITVTSPLADSELTVVNADTDTPLYALVDGLVIQKADIGNTPLGIIFEPGTSPGSVRFTLSGPLSRNYSEGAAPYSLYGDIGVDIQGRVFPVGEYTLVVNPSNGPAITVNFSVVQGLSSTAKSAPRMQLSPNPATDRTTVSFPHPVQLTQFFVYDVTGRLVKTIESETAEDIESIELSVYDLPIGTYFVRTTDTSGNGFQQRLIIEK